MKTPTDPSMTYHDGDIDTNRSGNPHLADLVTIRYSRRQTLFGGLQAAGAAVFGGMLLSACEEDTPLTSAPVQAGGSGTASSGRLVTLTGSVVSGTAASVAWTQVSGPAVTLSGASTANASFTAPAVSTSTPLVFRFTSTSADGLKADADTSVTVTPAQLGFTAVSKSLADVVAVPAGYAVTVLYRTGDPITSSTSAYSNNGTDTGFAQRAGDHHDGMTYFGLAASGSAPDPNNSSRGLLALNHENIAGTAAYLHPAGQTNTARGAVRPEGEAVKEIECHGVSVIEVVRAAGDGAWSYVQGSSFNRRITPNTTMAVNGPAQGNALLRTRFSADGTSARGTINNCANGTMPWNTYLTNEENWAGYFRRDTGDAARRTALSRAKENVSLARYGIAENALGNNNWASVVPADPSSTVFARWNATVPAVGATADGTGDFSHDPFTMGWVVEIDPFTPGSTPRKRTALGRMNHEGCQIGRTVAGVRPAFYMGDDAQNEYIYKFVSTAAWAAGDATAADRLAIGDKYLDTGTLYVAKFNADGSGQWLPLLFGQNGLTAANATYPFADQADVLINARLAADVLGATRMDRPEWTAVNPATGEMYCTLTNNSSRTPATTDAANPRAYTDPKLPQGDTVNADPPTTAQATRGNANGHVIRLREAGDTSEATAFSWDIYAFGSGADLNATNINLSGLDATNDFSSPDGMWFGLPSNVSGQATPLLWLQTDDGAYTDVTNCMMLAAIPGRLGDGGTRTVTNSLTTAANATTTSVATTRIGAAPGTSLRRFLVGPKECELTGIHTTPDGRSLFVNIQHPGENGTAAAPSSSWPYTQTGAATGSARPRSATIVITRTDGGIVGL
jgi:secreted PhoX family phosphatase